MSREGKTLLTQWMIGHKSFNDVVRYVADATDIRHTDLMKELKYSAEHMNFFDPDVITLIGDLRDKGVKVVIATDNMDTFSKWTVPALKLRSFFDDILVSDTLGVMKSSVDQNGTSLFFRDYLSEHAIDADRTVLIDDNLNTSILAQTGMDFMHVTMCEPLTTHLKQILNGSVNTHTD